jgi:hypothetical protein
MVSYTIAFVALVPPFEAFERAARQNFAVFFFAQRGVTALVRTGGVAELRVPEFGNLNSGVIEEVFRNSAGQDVGHGPREARNTGSGFVLQILAQTERWSWEHRDHVGEVKK